MARRPTASWLLLLTAACTAARLLDARSTADHRPRRVAAVAEPQRTPPAGLPPLRRRPPPPAQAQNASGLVGVLLALGHNWLIVERLTSLALNAVSSATTLVASSIARITRFPPRVMLVTMRGLIATEAEARVASDNHGGSVGAFLDSAGQRAAARRPLARGDLVNLERFERPLRRAFAAPGARAVALVLDSPGGSPAQSSLLHERLLALRRAFPRVKLLAFVEDAAVSGGYYIACAADEIVADHNSIVGSVGVISRGFGYVKSLRRKGVERRVFSAGDSKSGLDPFLPMRSRDLARQRRLLRELHINFIESVKRGRGDRLRAEEAARLAYNTTASGWMPGWILGPSAATLRRLVERGAGLFDGSVYSGSVALRLGLVDSLGEMRTDLERRYGRNVQVVSCDPQTTVELSRLLKAIFR